MKSLVQIVWILPIAGLMACSTDAEKPQTIIETGFIECRAPTADCNGVATCIGSDGPACVEAQMDCGGQPTCACLGEVACGGGACQDTALGLRCEVDEFEFEYDPGCETPDGGVPDCPGPQTVRCDSTCQAYVSAVSWGEEVECSRRVECESADRNQCFRTPAAVSAGRAQDPPEAAVTACARGRNRLTECLGSATCEALSSDEVCAEEYDAEGDACSDVY